LLRCFGNIICSGLQVSGAEACQRKELFPALDKLLQSDHQHVRKECLWVLSNISALDVACQEFVDSGLLASIAGLLSATFDLKKEAAYTLCNIAAHGANFCQKLVDEGAALPAMIALLKSSDLDTVHYALSFCEMIMQNTTEGVQMFQDGGGLESLEGLEYNNNESLRVHADNILDVYFYKEDNAKGDAAENENSIPDGEAEKV
jgi:hypothetical protein